MLQNWYFRKPSYSSFFSAGCPEFNHVGDGYCDDETNILACNYDGGDCCGSCVITYFCFNCDCLGGLTSIEVANPLVGDGYCDDVTNIAACGYDGGDCCGSCVLTEYCSNCDCLGGLTSVEITNSLVGNGFCDQDTNNIECNYDDGECCGPHVSCK